MGEGGRSICGQKPGTHRTVTDANASPLLVTKLTKNQGFTNIAGFVDVGAVATAKLLRDRIIPRAQQQLQSLYQRQRLLISHAIPLFMKMF